MRKHALLVLAVVALVCLPFSTFAQSSCRYVASQLSSSIMDAFAQNGIDYRDTYTYGQLSAGNSSTLSRTFYRGNTYCLGVVGDNNAIDMDIYIFDSNGNLIAKHAESDPAAVGVFRATYSGTYYIKVKMYKARGNACWALVYGYQ